MKKGRKSDSARALFRLLAVVENLGLTGPKIRSQKALKNVYRKKRRMSLRRKVSRPNLKKEPDEELLREKEVEEKARKRTRGPYRKSSSA
jgi:hypothetical protein